MGFDAIEFVDVIPHDGSAPEDYAKKLRAECARVGLPVSNFTFGADFINCPDTQAEIERVQGMVDLAEALGAKSIRHDATVGKPGISFDKALPVLADACRQVTEYAAQKGIVTMVENHGFFCQDSRRVEQLYNAVDHPNFGFCAIWGISSVQMRIRQKPLGLLRPMRGMSMRRISISSPRRKATRERDSSGVGTARTCGARLLATAMSL